MKVNFLKNTFKSTKEETYEGTFFNSTQHEIKKLLFGIGKSIITENEIEISDYHFEPSIVYSNKIIKANEIDFVNM
ncbi:hypothetical protein [Zunongwangia sp.]|uniref:hypothetical protein n=1 Tax=Zunongwangia sp. TaxID=1965325 RepID=UPI003AA99C50